MAKDRVFTIKINGVDKSYKDVVSLNKALDDLEEKSQKKITLKIDGIERAFMDVDDLKKSIKEMGDTKNKVFTIKIDGIEKSFQDVAKLVSALEKLQTINVNIAQTVEKAEKAIKAQNKAVTEEEKAQRKLNETQDKATRVITETERLQAQANVSLRERTRALQLQAQAENASANSIEGMRIKLSQLKDEWKRMDVDSEGFEELTKEIDELNNKIKEFEQSTGDFRRNVGNYEGALAGLEDKFNELSEGVNSVAENSQGMLNLLQAGIGTVLMFDESNEELNEVLADVGKIMAIVGALQAANNTLLKNGAIASKTAALMEGIHAIQVRARAVSIALANKGTVQAIILQKALNLVMKVSPIMWFIGALSVLVGLYLAYKNNADKTADAQEKLNKQLEISKKITDSISTSLAPQIATYKKLQIQWNALAGDLKAKQKFITENKAEFEKLGISVNSVSDAENVLVKNTALVVKALQLRAKATAMQEVATEKYKEAIQAQIEADKFSTQKNIVGGGKLQFEIDLDPNKKLNNQIIETTKNAITQGAKANEEIADNMIKGIVDLQTEANELLESGGIKTIAEIKDTGEKAGDEIKKQQDEIKASIKKYLEETAKLEQQNVLDRITANREYLKSIEEVNGSFADQSAILKEQSNENIKTVSKEYDELIKKATEAKVDTTQLTKDKAERIKQIEGALSNELVALERERLAKVKELNEKAVQDRQQLLSLELSQLDTFYNSIDSRLNDLEHRDGNGLINVKATKKNIDEANRSLVEYLGRLQNSKSEVESYYNGILSFYSKDSIEYKEIQLEKQNALIDFQKRESDINKSIEENTRKTTEVQGQYWKELSDKLQEYTDRVMQGVTAVFDATNTILQSQLDAANEKYDAITKKYDEVVAKREESDSRLQELEEQAKTATGGRFIILQQQITDQMQANRQLAEQEKQLAKEKEKSEKEIAKKERQQKKVQLVSDIATATANTALGFTRALEWGFPLGPIFAAIIGASGALQVMTMTKQLAKLEDGGLLNGKRHANGGMRVEGTNIEVEGGEYVINRTSTSKNIDLIKYINSQRRELGPSDMSAFFSKTAKGFEPPFRRMFEEGGQLPVFTNNSNIDNEILIDAIKGMKIESSVSVVDINNAQKESVKVDNWTGV